MAAPIRSLVYSSLLCSILEVARYVESHLDQEEAPGCSACGSNRRMLEKAWQTIANEYYDPQGRFSQARWAKELLLALQVLAALLYCA
jgi:hypothetical protein